MVYLLIIKGRLSNLNDYISAERTHRQKGAKLKVQNEKIILNEIKSQLKGVHITKPVTIDYLWVEKNKRRDLDNVAFAKKFIQDALVQSGVLKNDGWREIEGFTDSFDVDAENPRIEVVITERGSE